MRLYWIYVASKLIYMLCTDIGENTRIAPNGVVVGSSWQKLLREVVIHLQLIRGSSPRLLARRRRLEEKYHRCCMN
jgi:hypothetical protein